MRTSRARRTRLLSAGLEPLESRCTMTALPSGFTDILVDNGLSEPTAMVRAPDGRFFVAEKGGDLQIIKNGQLLPTPFLHLNVDSAGERGLIGVTLDPHFATNHFVYVHYTVPSPAHNRVSRFTASGDVAVANSELPLIDIDNLSSATNHNGGAIHFGKDGKLYIGVGENATGSNSQTLSNLLGKMLRINADGTIPSDNPFFNTASGKNRAIWALGLRNPFTFGVHRTTGQIFINDVGQSTFEEIDRGVAGANYGWPNEEGPDNGNANFVDPIYFYQHNSGTPQGIAITGGAFYDAANPNFPPAFANDYYFADLGGNFIWRYDPGTDTARSFALFNGTASQPVDMLVAPNGDLYYLAMNSANGGVLRRIHYTSQPPQIQNIGGAVNYPAGSQAGVRLSATATVVDPDSADFQAGRLRVGLLSGGRSGDQLFIKPARNVTLSGNTVRFDGQTIGTFSGGTGGNDLLITFNARATAPIVRGLLRTIFFRSTLGSPATNDRVVSFRLTDGDGGLSPRVTKVVHVTAGQSASRQLAAFAGNKNGSEASSSSGQAQNAVVVAQSSDYIDFNGSLTDEAAAEFDEF